MRKDIEMIIALQKRNMRGRMERYNKLLDAKIHFEKENDDSMIKYLDEQLKFVKEKIDTANKYIEALIEKFGDKNEKKQNDD